MAEDVKISPLEEYAAIQKMQKEKGWEILMQRYALKGDELLTKILDTSTSEELRRLYVFQLETLGHLAKVLADIKLEAEHELARQKEPRHVGT